MLFLYTNKFFKEWKVRNAEPPLLCLTDFRLPIKMLRIHLEEHMTNIYDILEERGFIEAVTNPHLKEAAKKPLKVYCGFDPTSDSLHVGSLVPLMGLAWFQRCGHTPVAIVGGATGMIGDPSGKSTERQLLDEETIQRHVAGIKKNLETVLSFHQAKAPAVLLNNLDWFKHFSYIDFLRDIGKHFRIGTMIAKDSVKSRMTSEEGMSYTEFSYQLLQGYDFLHLFEKEGVAVQIGGSDQWGNITAGIELIRKVKGGESQAYGLTFPLLTRSDGQKFGKSEQGAIWLSPEKLSPFEFYQYFIRIPDADVIRLLLLLTFLEMEEIREIEQSMKQNSYVPNTAQKILAEEVTRLIHGQEGVQKAIRATQGAAPGSQAQLDVETLESIAGDIPSLEMEKQDLIDKKIIDVLVAATLLSSKGEARRLLKNGGVYLNNLKVEDENFTLSEADLLGGRLVLLAAGKKTKMLVKVRPF